MSRATRAAERAAFAAARDHGLRRRHARKLARFEGRHSMTTPAPQETTMPAPPRTSSEPYCEYTYDDDAEQRCERVPVDGGRYCRRHRWLEDADAAGILKGGTR